MKLTKETQEVLDLIDGPGSYSREFKMQELAKRQLVLLDLIYQEIRGEKQDLQGRISRLEDKVRGAF